MMPTDGDDSDDDDIPNFLRPDFKIVMDDSNEIEGNIKHTTQTDEDYSELIEMLWLQRDTTKLANLMAALSSSADSCQNIEAIQAIEMAILLLNGSHTMFFTSPSSSSSLSSSSSSLSSSSPPMSFELLHEVVSSGMNTMSSHELRISSFNYVINAPKNAQRYRYLKLMLAGTLLLEIYCQANYTGPELTPVDIAAICGSTDEDKQKSISEQAIRALECDGDYPFPICQLPQLLFISRSLLSLTAEPEECFWQDGIHLDSTGVAHKRTIHDITTSYRVTDAQRETKVHQSVNDSNSISGICHSFSSRHWRSARAAVIHLRMLQNQTFEHIPTLWLECSNSFSKSVTIYGKFMRSVESVEQASAYLEKYQTLDSVSESLQPSPPHVGCSDNSDIYTHHMLEAQLWLEWGLCQHFFQYKDKGKLNFLRAQCAIGLHTLLTASVGKRTKYQREDIAQLYLVAKSSILGTKPSSATTNVAENTVSSDTPDRLVSNVEAVPNNSESILNNQTEPGVIIKGNSNSTTDGTDSSDSWKHGEWEMGRRLVSATATGEEAALREVRLDDVDGGAAVNIVLEGGPRFATAVDQGGALHSLDQAVLLCMCLDVANSNPADGLTNEQMQPFIERVLSQANNWMIHSTALLQRSWMEYERRKTADRALLQMQALLDQHTTRLTIMQSTYQSIETAAKSYERLQYLHSLSYPAQYEFKRDLANKYLRYQVFSSALNLFKELEMWDEVVTCYQLMDKPHRAELVVRERLKSGETTPYMLTSLGDLTHNEDCYEQAWKLSNGRFARAKRTLARLCFDRHEYGACIRHMDSALTIQPLVPKSWYLLGIACMHIRDWNKALEAFTRCAQQDMEIGEAWANMGAIYVELKDYYKAYASFTEALKQKRDSWKIIENLMVCSIEIKKYSDAILYMNMLLDQSTKLKTQAQNPIHINELRRIIVAAFAKDITPAGVINTAINSSNGTDIHSSTESIVTPEKLAETHMPSSSTPFIPSGNDSNAARDAAIYNKVTFITKLEKLLIRLTNTMGIDSEQTHSVWDAFAVFYTFLNKSDQVKDCRVKQFRAIINTASWEKSSDLVDALLTCAERLVQAHQYKGVTKLDLYGCKSLLQSAKSKLIPLVGEKVTILTENVTTESAVIASTDEGDMSTSTTAVLKKSTEVSLSVSASSGLEKLSQLLDELTKTEKEYLI